MSVSRKRVLSDDSHLPQSKYLINQKMVNSCDETKMKQIYEKTVDMLFKAAAENSENQLLETLHNKYHVKLSGSGDINYQTEKPPQISEPAFKCESCNHLAKIYCDCYNCNLKLCEFCGYSCFNCSSLICQACISLFDCGSFEQPSCESCKIFK